MRLPDRNDLKQILASLDVVNASAKKYHPDEVNFRITLRVSVRLCRLKP